MVAVLEAQQACQKFSELEFYNSRLMSIGISNYNKKYELTVFLFKNIRTDNLPQEFEGFKVNYTYHGC